MSYHKAVERMLRENGLRYTRSGYFNEYFVQDTPEGSIKRRVLKVWAKRRRDL